MRRRRYIWLLAALPLLMGGCLKDSGDTIILMGTEGYVKDLRTLAPPELVAFAERYAASKGITIPFDGVNPPDIQGAYDFGPRVLEAYETGGFPMNPNSDDVFLRLGGEGDIDGGDGFPDGQHNRVIPVDFKESSWGVTHQDTAYLAGNGDGFVMYIKQKEQLEESGIRFTMARSILLCGTVNDEKVTQNGESVTRRTFRNAFLSYRIDMVEINYYPGYGLDPQTILNQQGWMHIYSDGDGVVEPYDWESGE